MRLARQGELTLLSCTRLFPARDLRDQAVGKRKIQVAGTATKWQDWDTALGAMANGHERAFYEQQIASGCEHYRPDGSLYFRHEGKRRWWVQARNQHSYVWQFGRVEGDEAFWVECLTDTAEVGAVENGRP